ncbi:MAG: hypothetical protein GXX99_04190 [Clostridiales bacterium]|nr:hypothetical protein [Clostridiales bacterium]
MKNYYVWRADCADCAKVDRWMAEMAAVMPELRPAIGTFERLERPQAEALGLCCDELPALFVEGERRLQGAPGKRGLLMLLQEVRRRLEAQD